ncbi:hypothetical protein ACKWTF_010317 [Chironomus riparius]
MKFIADPPTTTLQRLKGITTGSLPTFIDMGSNFATPEINEDNIIDQMVANNLTVVFAGDNTWTELFPKRFKRSYAYPSFNIHDLDSVDNAIMKILPTELKKPDWDVIITHFLGVDHCGHKHGALHHEMSRKLTEMNDMIKMLAESIDDDTTLLVFGDHGMTLPSGDHGGATSDETDALLFAYSKKKFVDGHLGHDDDFMQQIDLTPTLSTILGIPIPFSNLGTINFKLLPDVSYKGIKRHELLSMHLWHNAKQIKNYFSTYSDEHKDIFAHEDLDSISTKFEIFELRISTIFNEEAFKSVSKDLRMTLDSMLELCRNIWINFNPQLMVQGMLLSFLGIFVLFIIIYNIPVSEFSNIFTKKLLVYQAWASVIAVNIGYVMHENFGWDDKIIAALFLGSICHVLFFGYIIIKNWTTIVESMMSADKFINLMSRMSFAFSIAVFFSNSFIVQEQYILCFLLIVQIIHALHEYRKAASFVDMKKLKITGLFQTTSSKVVIVAIITIGLLRMSQMFFKCREEQGNCWDFLANTENVAKVKDGNMKVFPVIILAIFVTIVRAFLKANGNLTGYSPHVILMKFGPTVSVVAACGYLVLSQKQMTRPIASFVHLDTLAWIVYGIFIIELIIFVISPLLVYILPRKDGSFSLSDASNAIPELYRHMKQIINDQTANKSQTPVVYGLATVYSSVFLAFGTVLSIVLALLLGIDVCNGFVIILFVGSGILFIFSILRYESSSSIEECFHPSFSLIVTWYLLYSYGFYSTSHQPTISQIDWNAAFVGRTANFDHSNILSAILVLLSTFNSNIVLLILYPLLVIGPFMIYALWPNMPIKSDKKTKEDTALNYRKISLNDDSESNKDIKSVSRGEINLHENENIFMTSVFKVGCQFLLLQGTKVFASMIACTILCRHLMVWKIFAPRFIYEGIATYISFVAIVLGFVLVMRINRSVKSLINKLIL